MGHLAIKGDEVGQAGPAFHEAALTAPDPLVVLHMLGELTQDEPLHNLPWYRGQADRHVVPWILLPTLFVDGRYVGKQCELANMLNKAVLHLCLLYSLLPERQVTRQCFIVY